MACFDLLGTGSMQLILGWESNKVDIRDIATGESLFKLTFNQMVISVMVADYRSRGANDLVICTRNGEGNFEFITVVVQKRKLSIVRMISVKGYERSKVNLHTMKRMDRSELNALMTKKKNLMLELSQYQSNSKVNKEHSEYEIKFDFFARNFFFLKFNPISQKRRSSAVGV